MLPKPLICAQGRKIIFSTNLPNVKDLDDALIRPGRCFARISVRELTVDEAKALLHKLCGNDSAKLTAAEEKLIGLGRNHIGLADIYKVCHSV